MDIYFFDCDKTLYDYNFRRRLPALAEMSGMSQYHLASTWWTPGHERAAESGLYATSEEYLAAFAEATGAALTADQWRTARRAAMTRIDGAVAALRWASERGTVSLLSNNPIIFKDSLAQLAPDVAGILAGNDLVSAVLRMRKPDPETFRRALAIYGAKGEDAFFVDDSAANVAGARAAGLTAFQLTRTSTGFDIDGLNSALKDFANR